MRYPKIRHLVYGAMLLAIIVLFYIFNSYSPADAGPLGMLAIFICAYLVSLGVAFLLFDLIIFGIGKLKPEKRMSNVDAKRLYYIASTVAFLPTLLLAVQSVGQLSITDVLLAFVFVGLAAFYVFKRT